MKILAVCDSELNYARKLAGKLAEFCGEEKFIIQLFDLPEAILEYHRNTCVDTVLLGDNVRFRATEQFCDTLECFRRAGIGKIFVLSSEKDNSCMEYKCFYKYQAVSTLVKEILKAYSQECMSYTGMGNEPVRTEIVGIFAPVNCIEKTIWALLAGILLSKERPVLYVNLERYAGFDEILNRRHDGNLSEVFYHMLCGENKESNKIRDIVQSFCGLSYIPPIRFGGELSGISGDVFLNCINRLVELSKNRTLAEKTIILDFSGSAEEHIAMCNMCDRIFLVQRNDCITEATVRAFEKECEILSESPMGKIRKVYMSAIRERPGERFLELNLEGELGEKIKQILLEEGFVDGGTKKGAYTKAR
ncbi:MAG: hypothetical protein E7261_05250 [Lachnospiraceae bacterium]|nr:hypothetical protein [Lachnospiraceae bacterium]